MRRTVYMNNPQSCGLDPVGFKASAITLVEGTSTFVPELLLHLCAYTAGRRNQDVVRNYANEILSGSVDATELVFTTHTRHRLEEYKQKGSQAAALYQLREQGVDIQPGQAVQYVLTDHRSKYYHNRVKVAEMVDTDTVYDRMKYYDITLRAAESILRPFGYDADMLNDVVIGSKQMKVEWY